jgi:hypothetical protein
MMIIDLANHRIGRKVSPQRRMSEAARDAPDQGKTQAWRDDVAAHGVGSFAFFVVKACRYTQLDVEEQRAITDRQPAYNRSMWVDWAARDEALRVVLHRLAVWLI